MGGSRRVPLSPWADLSRTLCSHYPPTPDLSRTLCSAKWSRLAVDANRPSAIGFVSYCRSHQSDGKKLPGQFCDSALVLSILRLFVLSQFIRSLSRTLERKVLFWAGRAAFVSYSRLGKMCKHVKTRCFGRDFPYRRVILQNFVGESPIFEFLQFGAILLKI